MAKHVASRSDWWKTELGLVKCDEPTKEEFDPDKHILVKRKVSKWLLEEAEKLISTAPKQIRPEEVAKKHAYMVKTANEMIASGDTHWMYKPWPKNEPVKLPYEIAVFNVEFEYDSNE